VRTLPILRELPPGYFVEESPGGILALHVDVALRFHRLGFGPESDGRLEESGLSGRNPMMQLDADGERFLVRSFHHGGLLRSVTGARFLDPERPFRELCLSHTLNKAGLRTPQVVAARARVAPGAGWYLDLVTRRVEGSIDVGRVLGALQRGELSPRDVAPLVRALGRFVRALHRHGLLHADLTPRNVLATRATMFTDDPELWILDLDRSELGDGHTRDERARNLRRLWRHVERMELDRPRVLRRTDYVRFLVAYDPGDGAWKTIWRSIEKARSRRQGWHRLGWWFDRRLGRRSPLPDEGPLFSNQLAASGQVAEPSEMRG